MTTISGRRSERDTARAVESALKGIRPVVLLAGVFLTVSTLYLAREFLIPVAVASLLTFLLNPFVRLFERRLPRAAAVVLVVVLTFSVLGVLTWTLALQVGSLGGELPAYVDNLKRKIVEVRGASRGGVLERVQSATKEVVEELQKEERPTRPADRPVPVVVKSPSSTFWQVPAFLNSLTTVGLVLVLVIFMLLERLELRDRLIRLIGLGRIATTTKAMDEAAHRITRYLTVQTLMNGSFGVGVALGTLLIGVPYAFVWGLLAGVLRFIPYVGPWAAALTVSLVSLAVFDGWLRPVLTAGMFVVIELLVSLVLEPRFYSQTAGVSQVALLLAVAFWTWIWGPIGLALATPLTVCLLVVAKHVPDLEMVTMLLSDEPVMTPDRSFYQRLVARDESEAQELVAEYVAAHPEGDVDEKVFVPGLNHAQRDYQRGRITDEDLSFVDHATRQLVEEMAVLLSPVASTRRGPIAILALPVRGESDEIALLMLKRRLDPERFALDIASPEVLASEAVALVDAYQPVVVVVGALAGAGQGHHLRHLRKELRVRFPDLPIILGWWGARGADLGHQHGRPNGGPDRIAFTLSDACAQLQELAQLERSGVGRQPVTVATP